MVLRSRSIFAALLALSTSLAIAGPPYVTDDPEPTDKGHYEIYLFAAGTTTRDESGGAGGIDFNYGAADDLQLTMVLPVAWTNSGGMSATNLGGLELAAKYKFLHQDDVGVDVAFFPRVILPAGSELVGERHVSLLLPFWASHSWDRWNTFGGGGCTINHGGDSQNFCEFGWALTREVVPGLQLGAEIDHETADTRGGRASTGIGFGASYDLNDNFHLMGSLGPGIQNAAATNRMTWYTALLLTF